VSTAYELGWATLKNGELLAAAELIQQKNCHRCSKYHQLAPHSEKRL
jgi:hypothetical protein